MIQVAAIVDNRMLADSLRSWADQLPDIRLAAVTSTVDELLAARIEPLDLVLLDSVLRADPDLPLNVRRLLNASHRVLVIDGSGRLIKVARTLALGAHGYLTRDHGYEALTVMVRAIASGDTAWSIGPPMAAEPDCAQMRPRLSEREHAVLLAYASGMTIESTARHLGISPGTARTYLMRVKAKYQRAGLPVHTKLDLAERVRQDCVGGVSRPALPRKLLRSRGRCACVPAWHRIRGCYALRTSRWP